MNNDQKRLGGALSFCPDETPLGDRLYDLDGLIDELDALNQRWNQRITGKDLRSLGELYT